MICFEAFCNKNNTLPDYFDKTKKFKHFCWELYKIDWLFRHGFTLRDTLCSLANYTNIYQEDYEPDTDPEDILTDWENKTKNTSGIYKSYYDFTQNEFQDINYMRTILRHEDMILYNALMQNGTL